MKLSKLESIVERQLAKVGLEKTRDFYVRVTERGKVIGSTIFEVNTSQEAIEAAKAKWRLPSHLVESGEIKIEVTTHH
jgi:hypothetical protein